MTLLLLLATLSLLQPETSPPKANSPALTAPAESTETSNNAAPITDEAALNPGAATFDAKLPAALEVKRVKGSILLVKPTINGKDAGWFIFDTGAGICVLSTPHLSELGLTRAGSVAAVGVGGSEHTPIYRARTMALGPVSLANHPFIASDLSFLKQHLGEEIVGVIGYGVLARSVAELDLKAPSIALHDPAAYKLRDGAAWTRLDVSNRTATVHATFDGGEGDFGLDTGANGFVTFHEPITREKKLLEGRESSPAKIGGVGGFVEARTAELAWFELAGVRREKIKATFATEAKGTFANPAKAGNIGTAMLEPFILVLDYSDKRIAFVQREPAQPTVNLTEAEKIEALLQHLEKSDALFIRNGSEHTGKEAAEHLRGKLKSAGDRIKTAHEFIEQLASKSSLSGTKYQVKPRSGPAITAREWFEQQLRSIEKGE